MLHSVWWGGGRLTEIQGRQALVLRHCFHVPFNAFAARVISAGVTIVANVAIATGTALLKAPRSSVINLMYYIIYKNLFSLRSQYFAKVAISSKRRFSIERCLCPEILVWFFLYSHVAKGISFKIRPTHFSCRGKHFSRGGFARSGYGRVDFYTSQNTKIFLHTLSAFSILV